MLGNASFLIHGQARKAFNQQITWSDFMLVFLVGDSVERSKEESS